MSQSYQPESRRPIADVFRRTADLAVRLCVRLGISANLISVSSTIAAASAALCLVRSQPSSWLLLLAPGFMLLRLWLNMLDGMVALASGKASRRGELYNEIPDRISDFLIFGGVAHSGWALVPLGYWGGGAALLVAYIGTFGQALGAGRQFGGVMSKQWRMVALCVGCIAVYFIGEARPQWLGLQPMDWILVVVLAGCLQTVWTRLRTIVAALDSGDIETAGES